MIDKNKQNKVNNFLTQLIKFSHTLFIIVVVLILYFPVNKRAFKLNDTLSRSQSKVSPEN